ncbi:MAG: hypothetical protein ACPG8W_17600 [Candidatus Promineifilaceae bacterium]
MKKPNFDADGRDNTTFAPFILHNQMDQTWRDVRLAFHDWDWFEQQYGPEIIIDDYYLNSYGIQGLVMACRFDANLEVEPESIHYNSGGDTCYIHFTDMDEAIKTAALASSMIKDKTILRQMIQVARNNGFEE